MKFIHSALCTFFGLLVLTGCSQEDQISPEARLNQETVKVLTANQATAIPIEHEEIATIQPGSSKRVENLSELLALLAPETQSFIVDAAQETIITGRKGTKVYIPANSLVFEDGSAPKGSVYLQLKECYTLADLLSEELSTKAGNELLESGGTVKITAQANGQALKMKNGAQFALYFPRDSFKKGMELFYGQREENGNMDWKLPPQPERDSAVASIENDTTLTRGQSVPTVRILSYTTQLANVNLNWDLANSDLNMFDHFNQNFNGPVDVLTNLCALNATADLELTLNENGKIDEIYFVGHALGELNHAITTFFKNMPALDMSTMSPYATHTRLKLTIGAMVNYDNVNFKSYFEQKYARFKKEAFSKVDGAELEYYVLAANQFGWINCDRFIKFEEEKIDVIVETDSPNATKVMLAFTDLNAMMQTTVQNGKAVFSGVPVDQKVKVIGLSTSDKGPRLAQRQLLTGSSPVELNGYRTFNLGDLEGMLK